MVSNIDNVVRLLSSKEYFLFDMDGTLVDLEELNYQSFSSTVKDILNLNLSNDEYMSFFAGAGSKSGFGKYLKSVNRVSDVDALVKSYRQLKRESLYNRFNEVVTVKDGAHDYLKALNEKGVKLALCTSTVKEFGEYILEHSGLAVYFDIKLYRDDIVNSKPHPEIFLKSLELLGGSVEKAVVFEDSKNGIESAVNANIDCVIIHTKGHNDEFASKSEYVIENYLGLVL